MLYLLIHIYTWTHKDAKRTCRKIACCDGNDHVNIKKKKITKQSSKDTINYVNRFNSVHLNLS